MMLNSPKILLSGVKPTGRPHIGNYFGAMKQFVDLQNDYESYIMIADYHALTNASDPEVLRQDILDIAIDYLAIGLDPTRTTIFQQSNIPEHTELAWIFNCLTTMPYLARAHAYKDALAKNQEVSVGVFTYPLLMAADILLYDAAVVPVGFDQKQHVEIARDTAEKFNRKFGEIFQLPEALIIDQTKTIIGIDGQKMSKSYGNTIPIFSEPAELKRLIMSIKTDSREANEAKDPEQCNVFALHKLFSVKNLAELAERYRAGQIGYKESKEILFKNLDDYLVPLREKRLAIARDQKAVMEVLQDGASRAKAQAQEKMVKIRQAVGVSL